LWVEFFEEKLICWTFKNSLISSNFMKKTMAESVLPRWNHSGGKLVELGAEKLSCCLELTKMTISCNF